MMVTITEVISTTLISSVLVLIELILFRVSLKKFLSSKILMVFGIVLMVRLVLPFEFFYTFTIPSKMALPQVSQFLRKELFAINGLSVNCVKLIACLWIVGSLYFGYQFARRLTSLTCLKSYLHIENKYKKGNLNYIFVNQTIPPCVVGVINPTIIIPTLDLSKKEIDFLIRHELMHIANFDVFIKYCFEFLSVIYWWNPLIHLFKRHLNLIIELKADELVIEHFSDQEKIDYVQTLVKLTKMIEIPHKSAENQFVLNFVASDETSLLLRSKNILNIEKKNPKTPFLLFFGIVCFIISSIVIIEPYKIEANVADTTIEITDENSYLVETANEKYKLYSNDRFLLEISEEVRVSDFHQLDIKNK